MSELIKIGAMWKGKTKAGKPMLSGTVNRDTRIVILENSHKEKPNQPDFYLFFTANEKKDEDSSDGGGSSGGGGAPMPEGVDDDMEKLPF